MNEANRKPQTANRKPPSSADAGKRFNPTIYQT